MRTTVLLMTIVLSTMCYAIKITKKDFARIEKKVKVYGIPTETGFEYALWDASGYSHTLSTTTKGKKITVWSNYHGPQKDQRSFVSWEIKSNKLQVEEKTQKKKIEEFYVYILKTL